jgi:hypothetical protein
MSPAATAQQAQLRVVRRQSTRETIGVSLRLIRPSVLDLRLAGDWWMVDRGGERLGLYFNNWQLTGLRGLPFDLPALNHLIDQLRRRRPRHR